MVAIKRNIIVGLVVSGIVVSGSMPQALAAPQNLPGGTAARLDAVQADHARYRGRGARNAAIAGAVGLGVLGLAAGVAAANRRDYGPVYEYEPYPAYGYGGYGPAYGGPVVYERRVYAEPGYYAPRRHQYRRPYYEGVDPARSAR